MPATPMDPQAAPTGEPPSPAPPGSAVRFPLRVKLVVFAGLLLVAHIVGVGVAALSLTRTNVTDAQRSLQIAILEALSKGIEAELAQAHDGLDAVGRTLVDESLPEDSRVTLAKILIESNVVLDNVYFYTREGTEPLPVIEPTAAGLRPPDPLPVELRERAIARNVTTGSVFIPPERPETSRMPVVMPIRAGAQVTGFMVGLMPLDGILQRVQDTASLYAPAHSAEGEPEHYALFVVDDERRIIAHSDPSQAVGLPPADGDALVSNLGEGSLRNGFVYLNEYTRPDGVDVVATAIGIDATPWSLVVQMPADKVYAPIVAMRRAVVIAIAVALVIALVAALVLARRITLPLKQLSRFASDIARRDFSTRVSIHTRDELAMVGRAMSQAAADLQQSEQRIRKELEIRADLGRYLPAELVDKIIKREQDMALGGERREITVMFADLVAFTPLSEKLPPEQVVQILNELFTIVTEIVFRHGGTVDKFIGDCVMALWGAPTAQPDHAARALEAAEEIISWLEVGNASWEAKYGVSVRIAIGINSGEAVVGNVGSESRMEYTAIGTTVNVAARLEAIARPQQILISETTARLAGEGFQLAPAGERTMAGLSEPLHLYEVIG